MNERGVVTAIPVTSRTHGRGKLKFLIDTNILVPAEPATSADLSSGNELVPRFYRLVAELGHQIYCHSAIEHDFRRDTNEDRRQLRQRAIGKYPSISTPMHDDVTAELGEPAQGSNDWVDFMLISAVRRKAVHFLVTEDRRLRARATRLGLEQAVLSLEDAIAALTGLFEDVPLAPPNVRPVKAYELDAERSDLGELQGGLREL